MSVCRNPCTAACKLSRRKVSALWRGLAAIAAVVALFLPLPQARAASVGANPTAVGFTPLMVGFASPLALVTITNTGTVPLTHLSFKIQGASPHDFSLTPGPCSLLPPQEQCAKFVRFRPTAVGARSAALWIESAELPPQPVVQLTGEALAPAPKLSTSTDELDFSVQALTTTSAPLTVQVANAGAQNLDITAPTIAPAGQFILAPATDCTVSPLASPLTGLNPSSCTVSVKFTPNGAGPDERTATLTIASTDPDGPKQVQLRGEIARPFILVNPASIEFGSTLVGDLLLGIDGKIDITNVGTADLVISTASITNGNPNASDFSIVPPPQSSALPCTVKAGSGQPCTFMVRFVPHGTGDRSAKLALPNPDWNFNIILHGFGDVSLPTAPPIGAATDVLFCSAVPPALGVAPVCTTGTPRSCDGNGQLLVQAIPATRAFGSNNPGAPVIPQPTVAAAVVSGAMGPAVLEIMALGLGPPGSHSVILNSKTIGSITVPGDGQWHLATIAVPQTGIFFPGVAPIGSAPTPATNIVAIAPDVGGSGACVSMAWARLRIKAMSPVIFIHGMGSNGAFFARQGIAGVAGGGLGLPPTTVPLPPRAPASFQAAGIPTDTSINLPGTASVGVNAAILSTLIPGIVRSFGASTVHIVAHDKGGLDAREWLSINAPIDKARAVAPFRVISFTTLATPHQGTAAADLQAALMATSIQGLPVAALNALGFAVGSPAVLDLTTFAAPALEQASPLPTGVDYRSVGGDADRNSNGLIQFRPLPDEYIAERREQPLLAAMFAVNPPATDIAVTSAYQFMFTTRTVVVAPVFIPVPLPPFLVVVTVPAPVPGIPSLNDLLVTTPSALLSPFFSPLPAFVRATSVDHASVAGPVVGATIIPLVRASDILRGGLR